MNGEVRKINAPDSAGMHRELAQPPTECLPVVRNCLLDILAIVVILAESKERLHFQSIHEHTLLIRLPHSFLIASQLVGLTQIEPRSIEARERCGGGFS